MDRLVVPENHIAEESGQYMDDNLYKAAHQEGDLPFDLHDHQLRYLTAISSNNILHVAAQYGNLGFVAQVSTKLGDDVFHLLCQQNSKGETPLHLAAHFGHAEIANTFVQAHDGDQSRASQFRNERKECWKEKDDNGDTPLHRALRNGHQAIAILLIERDTQLVSVDNNASEGPAYVAVESSCNMFLERIIDEDVRDRCCISFSGPSKKTVFHGVAKQSPVAIIKSMMKISRSRPLLKQKDDKGKTALHYAVMRDNCHVVEAMLTADSSLAYLQDKKGRTSLHTAAKIGSVLMVELILELAPQSVDYRDNHGKTALHVAKMDNGFLSKCLNNTAMKGLINEVDSNGNTPLHVALINSKRDGAFQLFRVDGCNWRLRNKKGDRPLDLCHSNNKIGHEIQRYAWLRDLQHGQEDKRSSATRYKACACWYFARPLEAMFYVNLKWKENELDKVLERIGLAAILLLLLNFMTAIDVPGGYNGDGRAILRDTSPFNHFIGANEISFVVCVSVLIGCTFGFSTNVRKKRFIAGYSIRGLQVSLLATIAAYIWGAVYIVDKHSLSRPTLYGGVLVFVGLVLEMYLLSEWSLW